MKIQTFQSQPVSGLVSVSNFVSEYQSNIRNSIIPPTQLPIYINNYYVSSNSSAGGTGTIRVDYSTMELQPTNVYSKRIWNIHIHGTIFKDAVMSGIDLIFYENDTENDALEYLSQIGFEGLLSGTFLVRSVVNAYDASQYWSYVYQSDKKTLTLMFENSVTTPIDLTTDKVFDLYINIPNVILTSCHPGSIFFPPDNVKNVYCVHNSDPTGAFGNFAVSGDVVYTDFGQNYRITPSFLGSGKKLLLTLTKANPDLEEYTGVGTYFGPIFIIHYVGGPMYESGYITFENKTNAKVCVWIDPTVAPEVNQYESTHTFVDPGRNTVAMLPPFIGYLVYFDGQFSPCFP